MRFLTISEFETMRLYELDNVTYGKVKMAFVHVCGNAGADRLMEKFSNRTIRELTLNSFVDILSLLKIL